MNEMEIYIFNISDTKIKFDAVERVPSEVRVLKVPISREALLMYAKNEYLRIDGDCNIRTVASSVIMREGHWVGSFLYNYKDEKIQSPRLDWFTVGHGRDNSSRIVRSLP